MASGRNIKLYYAKESVFGTAPASANTLVKITNFDATLKQENVVSEARVGSRFAPEAFNVAQIGEFNTDFEVYPDTIGYIIKALLGSESKTGTGDIIHTFTPQTSETPISFTLQEVLSTLRTYNYKGCVANELKIDIKTKSIITASLSGSYQDEESATEYTGKSFSTLNPFIAHQTAVKIDTSVNSYLKSARITYTNNVYKDDYRLNSTKKVADFPLGSASIKGSLEFTTDYISFLSKYNSLASFALEFNIISDEKYDTDSYYRMDIILPYCFLTNAKINRDKEYMTIQCDFEACYNGTDAPITIKLYDANDTVY